MPNCIQLTKHGEQKATPFVVIDQEICTHFNVPCHPKQWHHGWYDFIGFMLAIGKDWAWLHAECKDPYPGKQMDAETTAYWQHMDDIVTFLEQRYTTAAWYEHKDAPSVLADEAYARTATP